MEISKQKIENSKILEIDNKYKNNQFTFIDLREYEQRYYPLRNAFYFEQDEFDILKEELNILNNSIMKKTVYFLFSLKNKDKQFYDLSMKRLGFSFKMIEILEYTYSFFNITKDNKLNFPLTHYGRFDLIIDKNGGLKVVEQNSETPAGFPEAINSNILSTNFSGKVDLNLNFEENLFNSYGGIIDSINSMDSYNLGVIFSNDNTIIHNSIYRSIHEINEVLRLKNKELDVSESKKDNSSKNIDELEKKTLLNNNETLFKKLEILEGTISKYGYKLFINELGQGKISDLEFANGEDCLNAIYIRSFFKNVLNLDKNKKINAIPVDDIEVRKNGLFYLNQKLNGIFTFYPMEWLFLDDMENTGKLFWDLYKEGHFDILNNPLTLIPQSKAFWRFLWENIDKIDFSEKEKGIIKKYIPFSSYLPFENSLIKPLFFREGVGIGDDSYIGERVYQEYIEQKTFIGNEFRDDNKDEDIEGYITLGLYFGDGSSESDTFIGNYSRFCKNKITDYTSYLLPVIIK